MTNSTSHAGGETAGTQMVEMTAVQRAEQALAFEATRSRLQELAAQSATLTRVDTDDNLAAAKAARAKLQSTRVSIEKTGKGARDEATKYSKAVIAKERELIEIIAPEEQRLQSLIGAEQAKRDEAERVEREAQQRRAEVIRLAFERVRSMPALATSLDVAGIDQLIAEAEQLKADQSHLPQDLHTAAIYEANVAINACKAARDRRVQADKDAEELAEFRRQREEQERRARQNEAEAARAARIVAAAPRAPVDDEDLPPPVPVPRAVPDSVQVPLRRVLPLARAARAALVLLQASGLGQAPAAIDLADALEEAGQ